MIRRILLVSLAVFRRTVGLKPPAPQGKSYLKNLSSLELTVSEELENKQTHKFTSYCFKGLIKSSNVFFLATKYILGEDRKVVDILEISRKVVGIRVRYFLPFSTITGRRRENEKKEAKIPQKSCDKFKGSKKA